MALQKHEHIKLTSLFFHHFFPISVIQWAESEVLNRLMMDYNDGLLHLHFTAVLRKMYLMAAQIQSSKAVYEKK